MVSAKSLYLTVSKSTTENFYSYFVKLGTCGIYRDWWRVRVSFFSGFDDVLIISIGSSLIDETLLTLILRDYNELGWLSLLSL